MITDIVFPNNNEQEFITLAHKLGYEQLIFVYSHKKNVPKLAPASIHVKQIALDTNKKFLIAATEHPRAIIENVRPTIIYGLEEAQTKDALHQRRSGLNHISAALATKHNVTIGVSISALITSTGKQRADFLGRTQQNITLCQKYNTNMFFGSFAREPYHMRSAHDMRALLKMLGVTTNHLKKYVSFLPNTDQYQYRPSKAYTS